MDDFWDGILATAVYQIEINEHSDITREFYSIEQAKEYLKVKFPTKYFDNVVIADLIREEKLELVASFAEEINLANAWVKSESELNKNPYFGNDYGLQYETDAVVSSHNPLSAFKIVATSHNGRETIANIVREIKGNHSLHARMTTKCDVLLFREEKYWKVVDVVFGGDGDEIENAPKCFLDCAKWGISAKSLERYCDTKNNISKSENSKKANQTQHGDKYALYEQIKPLWREKKHLIDSGVLSSKKFAMEILDSPLNHGLNGSKIMCGENSWRTITKL
jgi:hypothetical protein